MIYFAQLPTGAIKIGHSADVSARMSQLATVYGERPTLLGTAEGVREEEAAWHERFAHLRFDRTEQFRPAPELLEAIGRPLLASVNPNVTVLTKREQAVVIKGSVEWGGWVSQAAEFCRTDISKLVDAALIEYLKAKGYEAEAPKR